MKTLIRLDMMKFNSVFIWVVLISCSSASNPDSTRCAMKDWECLKTLFQSIVHSIGSTGISELGIPPIDPLEISDATVSLFGMVDLTLDKGNVTGVSDCIFDVYTLDLEKEIAHQENTCRIAVQGTYTVKSNPLIVAALGDDGVHGNGTVVLTLDKVRMIFDYPVYAQKKADGEIYKTVDYKNVKYNIEFLDRVNFQFDQLYIGDQETSKTLVPFLNQNWMLINKFRTFIGDKVAEIYFGYISKFLEKVPTKRFLTDDLNSIAKP